MAADGGKWREQRRVFLGGMRGQREQKCGGERCMDEENVTETDEKDGQTGRRAQMYCENPSDHLATPKCLTMMLPGAKYHQCVNPHRFAAISNYSGGVELIHIGSSVIFISRSDSTMSQLQMKKLGSNCNDFLNCEQARK